jgi:hypothetical protein
VCNACGGATFDGAASHVGGCDGRGVLALRRRRTHALRLGREDDDAPGTLVGIGARSA